MKKLFPELPDSCKDKTNQISSPRKANKNCQICKGRGVYTVLHVGEYEEIQMSVKCSCTNMLKKL